MALILHALHITFKFVSARFWNDARVAVVDYLRSRMKELEAVEAVEAVGVDSCRRLEYAAGRRCSPSNDCSEVCPAPFETIHESHVQNSNHNDCFAGGKGPRMYWGSSWTVVCCPRRTRSRLAVSLR